MDPMGVVISGNEELGNLLAVIVCYFAGDHLYRIEGRTPANTARFVQQLYRAKKHRNMGIAGKHTVGTY